MPRTIRLLISYDGSQYQGWQRQLNGPTIQGELEKGLAVLCGQHIPVHGAGRTDAGVHALGMTAHFLTSATMPLIAFSKGLNTFLPPDIRVLKADETDGAFHSRFSALAKTYRYDFCTGPVLLPYLRLYMAHFPGPFDLDRLKRACNILVGTHDFSSFERTGSRDRMATSGRGAVRTLFTASCFPKIGYEPGYYSIKLTGDGFLRQMVRIIAGTLVEIGQGKRPPEEMAAILAARNRTRAGLTAPACGLFLEKIYYIHDLETA